MRTISKIMKVLSDVLAVAGFIIAIMFSILGVYRYITTGIIGGEVLAPILLVVCWMVWGGGEDDGEHGDD